VGQDEYFTWHGKDKHSKAFAVLLEPRSKQIAKNLGLEAPATTVRCLDCHSTNVPETRRARSFDLSDGVGCESCHGPASGWLGPHTTRSWTHAESVKAGMLETKEIAKRVEVCLPCHVGDGNKTVDHQLIAAGHPDLNFEFETFVALMPAHWKPENEKTAGATRWALGQAIAFRENMRQFSARIKGKAWESWPDFADFECSSCHHNLVTPSARQLRGFSGRAAAPSWNEARYLLFRPALLAISPSHRKALDTVVAELKLHLQSPFASRSQAAAAADRSVEIAAQAIAAIEKNALDSKVTLEIIRAITSDASTIAFAGIRSAEQAVMSLDSLHNSLGSSKLDDAVNQQIGRLYDLLKSQSGYDPALFARELQKVGTLF